MKKLFLLACLAAGLLTLTGCIGSNAKRFFAENKGYTFKKCTISLSTPWGTEIISADEITSTVVYPLGSTNGPLILHQGDTLSGTAVVTPSAFVK